MQATLFKYVPLDSGNSDCLMNQLLDLRPTPKKEGWYVESVSGGSYADFRTQLVQATQVRGVSNTSWQEICKICKSACTNDLSS